MTRKIYCGILLTILMSGCQTAKHYGPFSPQAGTVHSGYPVQFEGQPKTANERIQVHGRGGNADPVYACLVGNVSIVFIGNMVSYKPLDKKEWPQFGYLSRPVEKSKAADGSNNFEAYFSVENVDHDQRNQEREFYSQSIYGIEWNDEVSDDGWMHGDFELRGVTLYEEGQLVNSYPENVKAKAKCTIFEDPKTINKIKAVMVMETMTPQQREILKNQ